MGINQWGMIKQSKYFILLAIILLIATLNVQAEVSERPLYLYYFETDDVLLETGETQAYQFTAFQGEKVTIVVYGLDELVRPEITLRNEANEVTATGRSTAEQPYVRYIQFTASKDETFTFDVSAVEAEAGGGLARVMLVEGDPIAGDLTYLDTVNPLLPGRVFMVAGSDEIDTNVTTDRVGLKTGAEVLPVERFREKPDIFVSRGSPEELPPIAERFSPNESHVWFNEDGNKFYFFTVHAIPEQLTRVTAEVEYEALNLLTFFYFDYFFIVGAGSDPVLLSQESQPCSEVTLENRVDCEREPVVQPTPVTEEDEAGPPEIVIIDTSPPELDFDIRCFYGDGYDEVHNIFFYIDVCTTTTTNAYNDVPQTLGVGGGNTTLFGSEGGDILIGGTTNDLLVGDNYEQVDCSTYDVTLYYYYGGYYEYDYNCISYISYTGDGTEGSIVGGIPYPPLDCADNTDDPDAGDKICGDAGNDEIYGGTGDDSYLNGGSGDDLIVGDDATITHDCIHHYEGYTWSYSNESRYCIHTTTYDGVGDDLIDGDTGNDDIYGGDGDDELYGGDGNDLIFGDGVTFQNCTWDFWFFFFNPLHNGAYGPPCSPSTTLSGDGDDRIDAGAGDDRIIAGGGIDLIDGGTGRDTIDYRNYTGNLIFDIDNSPTMSTSGDMDFMSNIEVYLSGSGDDTFNISGNLASTSDTNPIGISGGAGNDTVTFAFGTAGYFQIDSAETIAVCDDALDATCAAPTSASINPADYTGYVGYNTDLDPEDDLFIQVVGALPPPAALAMVSSERWDLSGEVGGSFDGGNGDDSYVMGNTPTVSINDTGTAGVDTVTYAISAAALTVNAGNENSFAVSDNTTTVTFIGVENIATGSANDIFLLHYNPAGSSNTYDAGENEALTDGDTAVLDTNLDLTVTVTDNTAVVNQTDVASAADTLVNFESVATGSGDDTFVMNATADGHTLDGGSGRNSIVYTDNSDTVVNLNGTNSLTVVTASTTDTLLNFDTVTTGSGDDVVNVAVNAASSSTDYTFNAGDGFNIFNFIFNSSDPLTDTVNVTVAADGSNNVLDFSGVDTAVTIDTSNDTPQEIFTNFWLTVRGVFEVVFGTEETTETAPVVAEVAGTTDDSTSDEREAETVDTTTAICSSATVATSDETTNIEAAADATSTPDTTDCTDTTAASATEAPAAVAAEATAALAEMTVEPVATTAEATVEPTATPEPAVEATSEPSAETASSGETTPEPPPAITPAPEATDQS